MPSPVGVVERTEGARAESGDEIAASSAALQRMNWQAERREKKTSNNDNNVERRYCTARCKRVWIRERVKLMQKQTEKNEMCVASICKCHRRIDDERSSSLSLFASFRFNFSSSFASKEEKDTKQPQHSQFARNQVLQGKQRCYLRRQLISISIALDMVYEVYVWFAWIRGVTFFLVHFLFFCFRRFSSSS